VGRPCPPGRGFSHDIKSRSRASFPFGGILAEPSALIVRADYYGILPFTLAGCLIIVASMFFELTSEISSSHTTGWHEGLATNELP
jgi:hypothetical protein